MGLRNLPLRRAYSSDIDDILTEFLIPSLQVSIQYQRLAGFFSSSSLAVAGRGMLGLIRNNGIMKLAVCPRLSPEDVKAILVARDSPEVYLSRCMAAELDALEDGFVKDHVSALGWMVASGRLEIRVCIPQDDNGRPRDHGTVAALGIFHQKVGILRDNEGNCVTFSGSVNETASGWMGNIEEFKVFRSWEPLEDEYQQVDLLKFTRFWEGTSPAITTVSVPQAVRNRLIELAPDNIEKLALERWTQSRIMSQCRRVKLFDYQQEAISRWAANHWKGILEMATGTGKTYTALGCVEKAFADKVDGVVIATPFQHLSQQWSREIENFGLEHGDVVFADSSRPHWKHQLVDALIDLDLGHKKKLVVLTTHDSLSLADFERLVRENRGQSRLLLVADEVHGLGAKEARRKLSGEYEYRLGLSATPRRWFDEEGTDALMDFFGGVVYEFPIERAINTVNPATGVTFLTPYKYIPLVVSLSPIELEEYLRKTQALVFAQGKREISSDELSWGEMLMFVRANIVKNAQAKYATLNCLREEISDDIKGTLVYCSPQQMDSVVGILNEHSISLHRFTMEEGTNPNGKLNGRSEREVILSRFANGEYQVLVAMKCLDEGVDVPAARTAVLMCSSGNPREYIQRIGRVIRRYPRKTVATIYDIVVAPSFGKFPPDLRKVERKIFEKELVRCRDIAGIAENCVEALTILDDIMNEAL